MIGTQIIAFKEPPSLAGQAVTLPAVFLPNEKAAERFFGFFTANIGNKNTRRAYYKASCRFSDWCEGRELLDLADVKPPHVAAYVEMLGQPEPEGQGLSKPTVKQHLAALRMLFDWLVVGHVLPNNPAHAVRGPKYSQKKGRTPVLDRDEARVLIAAIDTSVPGGSRNIQVETLVIDVPPKGAWSHCVEDQSGQRPCSIPFAAWVVEVKDNAVFGLFKNWSDWTRNTQFRVYFDPPADWARAHPLSGARSEI